MSFTYRENQNTPLTWAQLDGNFREVENVQYEVSTQVMAAAASAESSVAASAASQSSAELAEEMARISVVRWCGNSTTPPTTRLDGSPLEISDEYGNLTDNLRYNWTGESWVALNSSAQKLEERLTDPVIAGNGAAILGRGVVAVATLAELMSTSPGARRQDLRYLTAEYAAGTGVGGGEWGWANGDLSATVASDQYHGIVAPPTSDPTGASGAFFRIFSGEMYADWFGVVYGQTVDVTARLQAACNLIRPGRGLLARGDVRVDSLWDMSNLPPRWEVEVKGTVYAGAGNFLSLRLGGIYCRFKARAMEKLGGVREGTPYEMLSMFFGNLDITSIDKFGEGPVHIGVHSRPNGVNGIAWCNINIQNINVAGVCALFTTRTDTPGKTNGYINENQINIGYMGGRKGIWFKEGPEQTGGPFGGNLIIKPGFEQITDANDAALDLEFCQRNTIVDWRFEGPGIKGLQIRENSKCSRNVYRGSHSLTNTKLQFDGILARIDAQIITINGGLVAVGAKQLGNDSALTYDAGDAWNIVVVGDAVEQRVRESDLNYPRRIQVQSPSGVRGFLEVKTRNWYQFSTGLATVDVLEGMHIVSVTVSAGGTVVNMPLSLEMSGRAIQLNVISYAAGVGLSIRKSSGTVNAGAGVTSAGLYSLAYIGDVWRISKIGEAYSS